MPNSKVILLISGGGNRKCEWDNIHEKYFDNCNENACAHMLLYYSNEDRTATINMNDQCSLIFINETEICSTISDMMEQYQNRHYAIAVHGTSGKHAEINLKVSNLKLQFPAMVIYAPVEFNHASGTIDSAIVSLMKSILDSIGDFSASFDALWKALVPSPAEEADKLRAEILTPLVGIDWITQLTQLGKKTDDSLLKTISDEMDTAQYKKAVGAMEKTFGTPEPAFLAKFKEMVDSKTVKHDDFKKAADELEIAIQDIENANS